MTSPATPTKRRWLPRLTLFRFFAWLTVLTLLGSHIATSYRLRQTQKENEQLRQRVGEPATIERDRITAGSIDLPAKFQWRFRVHKPADRDLVLKFAYKDIPGSGLAPAHSSLRPFVPAANEAGMMVIEAAVEERKGRATLRLGYGDDSVMSTDETTLPENHFFELERRGEASGTSTTVNEGRVDNKSGQRGVPVILLRVRCIGDASGTFPKTCDGLLVWLEDAP